MIIKRYLVSSMNEAMTRIRYELGKDAVIISQRKIKKPGFKGFFSKKIIEVTAAIDDSVKVREEVKEEVKEVKEKISVISDSEIKIPDLMQEIKEMKNLISNMVTKAPEKSKRKNSIQIKLENSDLNEKVIKKILTKVKAIEENIDETDP